MALKRIRLGDYIEPLKEKCGVANLDPYEVSGVNRDKEFFEPSKQIGEDTSNYQNVPPRYFACNLMHVGRDKVLPIAYNHTNKIKHVSPAYSVFRIIENDVISELYFFLYLKSDERDRFFWFNTDASIRDGMTWDDLCNVELNVPDLSTQEKFVKVYLSMLENQKNYERGLEDLKLVCDGYIEELREKYKLESLGPYISRVDVRNGKEGTKNVKGVSTSKEFRDTTSKVNKDELSNYKVVKPRQITFVQTTHNEKVFCNAFNNTDEDIVVTSVNEVFECDETKLLPEYLCMIFNRNEFDRYARFHSWGSARETFTWNDLIQVKIARPDITIQKAVVNIFNAYKLRKEINEKLKQQIKDICPILIKGSIEEAREA